MFNLKVMFEKADLPEGLPKWFPNSKTIAFNLLAVGLLVANHFGYADFTPDPMIMALATAILNLLLRFVTKRPISVLPAK